ncbi:DUF3265 domain-containing protein [Vibrio vulnificus]|nr:DUF3265 domain-containing protein [Vibrio vulnificus]
MIITYAYLWCALSIGVRKAYNKQFKSDSPRLAFLVCGDFCGESGVRKLGLGGIHPLTQR